MTISIYFGERQWEDEYWTVKGSDFELDSSTAEDYFKSTANHQKLWFKLTQNFKCFPCLIKLDLETVQLICNLQSTKKEYDQYDRELLNLLAEAHNKNPNLYIETR
jgi:hypothetical protein